MAEWGIFGDEAEDYTEAEAVEAGFTSRQAALDHLEDYYDEEDGFFVRRVEKAASSDDDWEELDEGLRRAYQDHPELLTGDE